MKDFVLSVSWRNAVVILLKIKQCSVIKLDLTTQKIVWGLGLFTERKTNSAPSGAPRYLQIRAEVPPARVV